MVVVECSVESVVAEMEWHWWWQGIVMEVWWCCALCVFMVGEGVGEGCVVAGF